MRVLWLSDYDPWVSQGGAELNDRGHVKEGWRRGHEVEVCTPQSFGNVAVRDFDFAVVSNVASFPRHQVEGVAEAGDYAVFHHDFLSICRYRLHFPQIERCRDMRCESAEIWSPVVRNAVVNVALSPLHEEVLTRYHGEEGKWVSVPSAVEPGMFLPQAKRDKRGGVLVVNPASFKGLSNVVEWVRRNPDKEVTLLGYQGDAAVPPNCEVREAVPYGEMPAMYGEHEAVLHVPETVDPFCRVVVEGLLSGCRVLTNRNVGATSYEWFGDRGDVATAVANAPSTFWEVVEEAV